VASLKIQAINPQRLGDKITEYWSPKIIAQMNDYHFKIAKVQGDFVWHSHAGTDETFIVLDGMLTIQFRDGELRLGQGEMAVVPKGIEHKPAAESECLILLIEPAGTLNTGDAGGEFTSEEERLQL
jgi:mannose-6-phosphate isomerase-like protein (cupin superfamily)